VSGLKVGTVKVCGWDGITTPLIIWENGAITPIPEYEKPQYQFFMYVKDGKNKLALGRLGADGKSVIALYSVCFCGYGVTPETCSPAQPHCPPAQPHHPTQPHCPPAQPHRPTQPHHPTQPHCPPTQPHHPEESACDRMAMCHREEYYDGQTRVEVGDLKSTSYHIDMSMNNQNPTVEVLHSSNLRTRRTSLLMDLLNNPSTPRALADYQLMYAYHELAENNFTGKVCNYFDAAGNFYISVTQNGTTAYYRATEEMRNGARVAVFMPLSQEQINEIRAAGLYNVSFASNDHC